MIHHFGWNPVAGSWIGFGLGWIGTIIFWGLLVWFIVALVRQAKSGRQWHESEDKTEDTALDILKQRYAKGEISKKEFVEMKKDIS